MNWSDWPEDPYVFPPQPGERDEGSSWGVAVIFLATGLIVTVIAFGSCVARIGP